MKLNIANEAFTISVATFKGKTRDIDLKGVPEAIWLDLLKYGVQQKFSDAVNEFTAKAYPDPDIRLKNIFQTQDNLLTEMKAGRFTLKGTGKTGDPIERESRIMAANWLVKKGMDLEAVKKDIANWRALVKDIVRTSLVAQGADQEKIDANCEAAIEQLSKAAAAAVAARAEFDIDLTDLEPTVSE